MNQLPHDRAASTGLARGVALLVLPVLLWMLIFFVAGLRLGGM